MHDGCARSFWRRNYWEGCGVALACRILRHQIYWGRCPAGLVLWSKNGVVEASNGCLACMAIWLLMPNWTLTARSRAFSGVRVVFSSSFCVSWSIMFAVNISLSSSSSKSASWWCSASDLSAEWNCWIVSPRCFCVSIEGIYQTLHFLVGWTFALIRPIVPLLILIPRLCGELSCVHFSSFDSEAKVYQRFGFSICHVPWFVAA